MLLLYADTSSLTGVMSPVGITTLLMGFYYIWKSVWVFFFFKKGGFWGCLPYCFVFGCPKAYKAHNYLLECKWY